MKTFQRHQEHEQFLEVFAPKAGSTSLLALSERLLLYFFLRKGELKRRFELSEINMSSRRFKPLMRKTSPHPATTNVNVLFEPKPILATR